MISNSRRLLVAAIALLLMCLCCPSSVAANPIDESICDTEADHFLAAEKYDEAIRLHREFLRKHPTSALAHYHLGFAQGMMGDKALEFSEYQRAAALGLLRWDLFLNMGLVLLEAGKLEAATDELRRAVRLNPSRSEPHFNLGLVYERRDMLAEAEEEMRAALRLEPGDLDTRNMLGVIFAQQGNTTEALAEWRDLLRDAPKYGPARGNLTIFSRKHRPSPSDTSIHGYPLSSSDFRDNR